MRLYAIIGDIESDSLIFEKCFTSRTEAKNYLNILKNDYKEIGIFEEYDDLIIFNNDDEYKIVDFECKGIKYEN